MQLTVIAPLAAKLQPSAHHPLPLIGSSSLAGSNSSSSASIDVRGTRVYGPELVLSPCNGTGALCSSAISCAVAVPEGNTSFSLTITCRRSGTARKTPKNATAKHHTTRSVYPSTMGSRPSISCVIMPRAGMMPTKPAARGIVPVATAVVWSTTFS